LPIYYSSDLLLNNYFKKSNKMKLSTVKWLSKAIALPLFITTLSNITPVGAEQIDRSRSSTTRESRSATIDAPPAVTDLNLSIPVEARMLPPDQSEPTNSIEPFWSSPSASKATPARKIKEHSPKYRSAVKPRSRLATAQIAPDTATTSTARSITIERHSTTTTIRRRKKPASTNNTNTPVESLARDTRQPQSSIRPRIATAARSPLSGNYLRLVRDPSKGNNSIGNPIYTLEAYVNGQKYQTFNAVSGTAITQNADRNRGNNFAPLPDGLYGVNNEIMMGTVYEVGKTFIAITPKFETGRNELGIHLDRSYNQTNGYDGTAGCIGITSIADRDAINEFVTRYHPRNLIVSINNSEQ
jgi:hypothetical protein